jgi:hypothetical protein
MHLTISIATGVITAATALSACSNPADFERSLLLAKVEGDTGKVHLKTSTGIQLEKNHRK